MVSRSARRAASADSSGAINPATTSPSSRITPASGSSRPSATTVPSPTKPAETTGTSTRTSTSCWLSTSDTMRLSKPPGGSGRCARVPVARGWTRPVRACRRARGGRRRGRAGVRHSGARPWRCRRCARRRSPRSASGSVGATRRWGSAMPRRRDGAAEGSRPGQAGQCQPRPVPAHGAAKPPPPDRRRFLDGLIPKWRHVRRHDAVLHQRLGGGGDRLSTVTASSRIGTRDGSGAGERPGPVGGFSSRSSKISLAAATPSALSWNRAPTARSGRYTSGARISTTSAVCRSKPPPTRRNPIDTATSATDSVASNSSASADTNATRSVPMVCARDFSVISRRRGSLVLSGRGLR